MRRVDALYEESATSSGHAAAADSGERVAREIDGYTAVRRSSMPARPPIVHSDPDVLGGTPVFLGTHVPVQTFFDYPEGGETLDEFLRQFPSVSRAQAVSGLGMAKESLLSRPRSA